MGIGERLQQARLRAGLSLPEISARTKIRTALLEAIERQDFRRLPQGILGRGYLRAYAREVDLDPESIVEDFRVEIESKTTGVDPPGSPVAELELALSARRNRQRSRRFSAAAAIVMALAGVVVIILLTDDGPTTDPLYSELVSIAGARADADFQSNDDVQEVADRTADELVSPVPDPDLLTVTISPASMVWVEATADRNRVLYQLLRPGEQRVVDARDELVLRIGDAGAFQYWLNGVRGREIGAPGAVRTIRITPENYRSFQRQ
jgi:cytoskeletal protein RodZ